MTARKQATHTSWKGSITFGMVSVPVKLYKATEERSISFRMVHGVCGTRTRSLTHCPKCEVSVERSEIVKGYEHEPDSYVLLDEDDFAGLPLRSTRAIDVLAFIPAASVPLMMMGSTFYVAPGEDTGQKPFALLRDAMLAQGDVVAVAKIARAGRESICVMRPFGRLLLLQQLIWPDEIRATTAVAESIDDVEVSDEELTLAGQLVEAMTREDAAILDEQEDRYREALLQVIEAKMEGREPIKLQPQKEEGGADLMAALAASVASAKAAA